MNPSNKLWLNMNKMQILLITHSIIFKYSDIKNNKMHTYCRLIYFSYVLFINKCNILDKRIYRNSYQIFCLGHFGISVFFKEINYNKTENTTQLSRALSTWRIFIFSPCFSEGVINIIMFKWSILFKLHEIILLWIHPSSAFDSSAFYLISS